MSASPTVAVCCVMRKLLQRLSKRNMSHVTAGKATNALNVRPVTASIPQGHTSATAEGQANSTSANANCTEPPIPITVRSPRGTATSPGRRTRGSVRWFLNHNTGKRNGVET